MTAPASGGRQGAAVLLDELDVLLDDLPQFAEHFVRVVPMAAGDAEVWTGANVAAVSLAPVQKPVVLVCGFHDLVFWNA